MGRRNGAISLGVSALIVITLILIVGFGSFLANYNSAKATTAQTSKCQGLPCTLVTSVTSVPVSTSLSTTSVTASHESESSSCTLSPCQQLLTTINFATANTMTESTVCEIMAEGTVNFAVAFDNTTITTDMSPVTGLPVVVGYYINACPNLMPDFAPNEGIGARTLNSSGMLVVCCMVGEYSFNFTYSGHNYYVTTLVQPEKVTCLTVNVPSGRANTTYSQTFQSTC